MTEAELIAALDKRASEGRVPALGIMGGTFDPVHVGHLALADAALSELGLDGMLYMPAGIPSFKRDQRLASPADRVAMVRLAVADRPLSAVSLREVERSGVTYTVDTLEELRTDCPPGTRLAFVMGEDSLASLHLWHRVERIVELAEFAVGLRGGSDGENALRELERQGLDVRVRFLETPVPPVSSTLVRERAASQLDIAGLVPPEVERYIFEAGLYGAGARDEWYALDERGV